VKPGAGWCLPYPNSFSSKRTSRLRHKKQTQPVLEAIAVSLKMTHGRVETLFLENKLHNQGPYKAYNLVTSSIIASYTAQ
jgi:hypothetical protein